MAPIVGTAWELAAASTRISFPFRGATHPTTTDRTRNRGASRRHAGRPFAHVTLGTAGFNRRTCQAAELDYGPPVAPTGPSLSVVPWGDEQRENSAARRCSEDVKVNAGLVRRRSP
jgi:hypothetical protein